MGKKKKLNWNSSKEKFTLNRFLKDKVNLRCLYYLIGEALEDYFVDLELNPKLENCNKVINILVTSENFEGDFYRCSIVHTEPEFYREHPTFTVSKNA